MTIAVVIPIQAIANKARKKYTVFGTSTGFELVASAFRTAVLYQLSYEHSHIGSRPGQFIEFIFISIVFPQFKSFSFYVSYLSLFKMNSVNWPAPNVWVFIAQLVEHCRANAEATGKNPVKAPKILFFFTLQRFFDSKGCYLLQNSVILTVSIECSGFQLKRPPSADNRSNRDCTVCNTLAYFARSLALIL